MYKDIFESIRNEAEKRNLRERTIQLYCSDVSYFLRWIGKNVFDLTLEDAESFLTAKRLEGRSPETHNHYRSAIKFLYKKVLKIVWDDDTVPAMKRERNLPAVLSRDEINAIKRFVRIRHYGLLSSRNKKKKITLCRNILGCKKYISKLKDMDAPAIIRLLYNRDICKCSSCGGKIIPLPTEQHFIKPKPHMLC